VPRVIFLALLCSWLAVGAASADIIEVRGKGVIDGKILSEDSASIEFKDAWGEVSTYSKKDVLLVERIAEKSGSRGKKATRTESGSSMDSLSFTAGGVMGFIEWVQVTFIKFWAGDPEALSGVASGAAGVVMAVKRGVGGYSAFAITGLILMAAGLLAAAIYGFQLVIAAFENNFLWGLMLIANGAIHYAAMFDDVFQPLFYLPFIGTIIFIIKNWASVRAPIISQIFAFNLTLIGFCILKASM